MALETDNMVAIQVQVVCINDNIRRPGAFL